MRCDAAARLGMIGGVEDEPRCKLLSVSVTPICVPPPPQSPGPTAMSEEWSCRVRRRTSGIGSLRIHAQCKSAWKCASVQLTVCVAAAMLVAQLQLGRRVCCRGVRRRWASAAPRGSRRLSRCCVPRYDAVRERRRACDGEQERQREQRRHRRRAHLSSSSVRRRHRRRCGCALWFRCRCALP